MHQAQHDTWALPKSPLRPGEHPLLVALRAVTEGTGYTAVAGRPLGHTGYEAGLADKGVCYWAMQATSSTWIPSTKADTVHWLPLKAALHRLDDHHDYRPLVAFAIDPVPTRAQLLVRHASAGDRASWPYADHQRPLDEYGRKQAAVLVEILTAYGIGRVVCAAVRRCRETVELYAQYAEVALESVFLFSAEGHAAAPEAAVQRLVTIVADPRPSVVCSQREAIPDLLAGLCAALGVAVPDEPQLDKGGYCVLHLAAGSEAGRVVGIEVGQPLP